MRYAGFYSTFEKTVKCKSLWQLQENIENAGGYGGDPEDCNFREYETAWIMEYNLIGRNSAQHYFSMKDKKWHRSATRITMYTSWQNARQPFKVIAQWLIDILGYRKRADDRINKFIQQEKIADLYGK